MGAEPGAKRQRLAASGGATPLPRHFTRNPCTRGAARREGYAVTNPRPRKRRCERLAAHQRGAGDGHRICAAGRQRWDSVGRAAGGPGSRCGAGGSERPCATRAPRGPRSVVGRRRGSFSLPPPPPPRPAQPGRGVPAAAPPPGTKRRQSPPPRGRGWRRMAGLALRAAGTVMCSQLQPLSSALSW